MDPVEQDQSTDDDHRPTSKDHLIQQFQCLHTISGHTKSVSCVSFSPNPASCLLASASADASVKCWNTTTGSLDIVMGSRGSSSSYNSQQHELGVNDVSWSPNDSGQYLITSSDDWTSRIWDVSTGQLLSTLSGHDNVVFTAAFNPFGTLVVTASFDETIKLWDVRSGKCLRTIAAHSEPLTGAEFSHDGSLVVSSSYDGLTRVWDTVTGQCLATLMTSGSRGSSSLSPITCARFSPNSAYVLTGSLDGRVRLWDYRPNVREKVVRTYEGHVNTRFCLVAQVAHFRGKNHTTTGNNDPANTNNPPPPPLILCGSENHDIVCWDVDSEEIVHTLSGHTDVVMTVAAHASRPLLASGALEKDKTIKIWGLLAPNDQ